MGHKHAKVGQLVILVQKVKVDEKEGLHFLIFKAFSNATNCRMYFAILNKPYMVIFHVFYNFHHFIYLSQVNV